MIATSESSRIVTDLDALVVSGERFRCIYVDPPWRYDNRASRGAAENHYPTMSLEEITALPVRDLAADQSHLFLWTTTTFLFDAYPIMQAWGFTYADMFVWCKPQMGLGNYWRVSHEMLLLGVRGDLSFRDNSYRSWAIFPRGKHSEKPEQVRLMLEKVSPGPRLELFGRKSQPGWTVYGDQIERDLFFAAAVATDCAR
jgi:N6-adenosine-specific RNA methylase IME4